MITDFTDTSIFVGTREFTTPDGTFRVVHDSIFEDITYKVYKLRGNAFIYETTLYEAPTTRAVYNAWCQLRDEGELG